MKSKVLFFGCNDSQIPYLQNLQNRGYYIVATDINNDATGANLADSFYNCGYDNFEGLEKIVDTEGPDEIKHIFTASAQFSHLGASHVANYLGLRYPKKTDIDICLDKTKFYPLFKRTGISIPNTHYVRDKQELNNFLIKYSNDTSFYLKSDFSKNPNYIYTGTAEEIMDTQINWEKDRYFREFYVLQTNFKGEGIRLNLFPDGYELYGFENGKFLDKSDWVQFNNFGILNRLLDLKKQLGMDDWLLKFDVLIGLDDYVVLDIGMDPPYRMKKYWESQSKNFIDFYLDLYL